jgi:hypothetical protein
MFLKTCGGLKFAGKINFDARGCDVIDFAASTVVESRDSTAVPSANDFIIGLPSGKKGRKELNVGNFKCFDRNA